MGGVFHLEVITPERVALRGEIQALVVPGVHGHLGVLADHAPMVVSLGVGVARYRTRGSSERMSIGGGFLEVSGNRAVILAETAELAGEIDVERARAARKRAEARLRSREEGIDHARARAALERALVRLKAVGQG